MKYLLALLPFTALAFAQHVIPLIGPVPPASGAAPATVVGLLVPYPGTTGSAPKYFSPAGVNATEANVQLPSPIAGTVTAIYADASVAPTGGGDTLNFRIGGVTSGSCNIASGAFKCSATGLSYTLHHGDLINGYLSAATTSSTSFSLLVRVEGVAAGSTVVPMFQTPTIGSGSTHYYSMGYTGAGATYGQIRSPVSGTIAELDVGSPVVAGAGGETFTTYDAGTSESTCLLGAGHNHDTCTSLTGTWTAGHLINASSLNNSGSSTTEGFYALLTSASAQALALYTSTSVTSGGGSGYFSGGSFAATETNVSMGSPIGGTISEMHVFSNVAAGAAGDPVTLYIAGSPTALTCTIANTAQTCDITGQAVALVQGNLISASVTNSGASNAYFAVYLRVSSAN